MIREPKKYEAKDASRGVVYEVQMGPNDKLAIATDKNLTSEQRERIKAVCDAALQNPGTKVLVLDGGLKLTVIRAVEFGESQ